MKLGALLLFRHVHPSFSEYKKARGRIGLWLMEYDFSSGHQQQTRDLRHGGLTLLQMGTILHVGSLPHFLTIDADYSFWPQFAQNLAPGFTLWPQPGQTAGAACLAPQLEQNLAPAVTGLPHSEQKPPAG